MAGQIRITPEQMNERAAQYRSEAENMSSLIGRLDQLLHVLQGEREGAASEAYAQRFAQLRPGFVQTQELILEIAAALDSTARTLSETDSAIAGRFRA